MARCWQGAHGARPEGQADKLPTAALSGLRWAPPSASPSAWHWKLLEPAPQQAI